MLFHTHLVFGMFLILVFIPIIGNPLVVIPLILIGSVIPDIDAPTSKVGKSLLLRPMQWCVKHRGFFHSFLAAGIISIFIWGWSIVAAKSFFIGYLGHLFLDGLTKEGVPIFWPLGIKACGPVKTGGYMEAVIFLVLMMMVVVIWKILYFN